MDIILKRIYDNGFSTIGKLFIDGKLFCVTLEPTFRHVKMKGKTRVPPGRFSIYMKKDNTPMIERYRSQYSIDGIPCLKDVINFENVYIHIGNYLKDTKACVLVGSEWKLVCFGEGREKQLVLNSTSTFKRLHQLISENEDNVSLTILNEG